MSTKSLNALNEVHLMLCCHTEKIAAATAKLQDSSKLVLDVPEPLALMAVFRSDALALKAKNAGVYSAFSWAIRALAAQGSTQVLAASGLSPCVPDPRCPR